MGRNRSRKLAGMSSYNCGDIVSVKLTDNGVEEKSFGYAVIISAEVINKNLQTVIVCPMIEAKTVSESRIGATFVPKGETDLNLNCVILSLQIKTISKKRIQKRISVLPTNYIHQIKESLQTVLDIDS